MAVRVRFAPSPTGHLHLGGFRTALLNYLFARKNQGKFILRLEDTDQARIVPGAAEKLEEDLKWLGISPDESPLTGGQFGPYVQSKRLDIYHSHVKDLVESKSLYECFCTQGRLDLIRKEAVRTNQKPGYDNKCRDLTRNQVLAKKAVGEPYVYRLKLTPEPVEFDDLLFGRISLVNKNDAVMIKSDGFPTYHYANVIDDKLMEISHVLRGVEWQISTGLHIQLYRALNWQPPVIAHLPVIMSKDGTKLSKRHGNISINYYKENGYPSIVLTNFVTKSGGGFYHNVDRILSLEELASMMEFKHLNSSQCRLDFNLLEELNTLYLRKEIDENLDGVIRNLKTKYPSADETFLRRLLNLYKTRLKSFKDLDSMSYLWAPPENISIETLKNEVEEFLLTDLDPNKFAATHNLNKAQFYADIRVMISGLKEGPPIAELYEILGKDVVRSRIQKAIQNM